MRLVAHATGHGDRAERLRSVQHELLCHLDPAKHDIEVHRRAQGALEGPMKMARRLPCNRGDRIHRNGLIQILMDEVQHPLQLPRRKSPAHDSGSDSRQADDKTAAVTGTFAMGLLDGELDEIGGGLE
jgi:hypothetical protein